MSSVIAKQNKKKLIEEHKRVNICAGHATGSSSIVGNAVTICPDC